MSLVAFRETYDFVSNKLKESGQLGQITSYEEIATKTLIIAAAGELEKEVTKLLIDMPARHKAPTFIGNFIINQGIKRKYHAMFDWNDGKINSFAGLFGSEKKQEIISKCRNSDSTKDFFYIGAERNRIAHNGLATESINSTFEEIWTKYQSATSFVSDLKSLLH